MTIPAYGQFSTLTLSDAIALYGDKLDPSWLAFIEQQVIYRHEDEDEFERLQELNDELGNDNHDLKQLRDHVDNYLRGITQHDDPLTIKKELEEYLDTYGTTIARGRRYGV